MPVYNAKRYLRESIDSVLRQDFENYEFIIINDGSIDESQHIINLYAKLDNRIVALEQQNRGLVDTLNRGVSVARGRYIARIDADDPWMEGKLTAQISMLEANPSIVLIGGGFEVIDENGYYIQTIPVPSQTRDIMRTMLLRNPFGHAGVVFRKDAFNKAGGYSNKYGPTEDYDMWIKLANLGMVVNLPYPVYRYRINRLGISQQSSERQAKETKAHSSRLWDKNAPTILTRSELMAASKYYLHASPLEWYGIALKQQMLSDNAQIGIKLIRRGHILMGCRQLFAVALTGRTGIRAVIKRILSLSIRGIHESLNEKEA